jgi:hypothetical protein
MKDLREEQASLRLGMAARLPDAMRTFRSVNPIGTLRAVLVEILPIGVAILAVLMEITAVFAYIPTVLRQISQILSHVSPIGPHIRAILLQLVRTCTGL